MPEFADLATVLATGGYKKANPYDARRKMAQQMMAQGMDTSPVQSPWQGAARLAQALAGGFDSYMVDKEEKDAEKKRSDALASAMAEPDPQKRIGLLAAYDPDVGSRTAGQLAIEQYKQSANRQMLNDGAANFGVPRLGGATGGPTQLSPNATAISGVETKGQPNDGYSAVGPVANAQGHRAYGKFQILEPNIGPWTQEVLGRAWTPQELIANTPEARDAQNKVFEAKFGQYVTKYGSPQAASRAWFAGEGGMNNPNARDVNGMTPVRYEQQFNQNLPPEAQGAPPMQTPPAGVQPGGLQIDMPGPGAPRPMPVGGAAPPSAGGQGADGMPPAPNPQTVTGQQAVVAPPAVPDVPRPQPTPQQLQDYQQRIRSGEFGIGPDAVSKARAALDAEIDRQWGVDRQRRELEYKQQLGDYQQSNKQRGELEQKAPMKFMEDRINNYETKTRPAAVNAVSDISAIHSVRQVLDAGAFTGTGADIKQFGGKLLEQLGIPSDTAVNTQVLGSVLAKRLLAQAGGSLGNQVSNKDAEIINNAAGGSINIDEKALRTILDVGEREARRTLKHADSEAARIRTFPGMSAFSPESLGVSEAPTYAEWSKANPLVVPQVAPVPGQMQPNGIATHPNPNAPTNMAPAGVPQGAVEMLRSNPGLADAFDAKYGPGSAARVLGR